MTKLITNLPSKHHLPTDTNDATWTADSHQADGTTPIATADDTDIPTSAITKNVALVLDGTTEKTVATAADGEGQGANVFGWTPENIKLTMPSGAQVTNAIYKANLTWTLSSTL
ncbi:WxL domain-containing protein [Latilactobacillus sakei]|uniref:WxL domain-containing protein n=1 Tax=Latilactobacillus sakei TaxID=1599 RepID=UPI0025B55F7A|nr:WxL domain-containing protein [Latilactobacillus sakei]MDN4009737.1 WxL domain-containing protein [Latilactobacillus sakei]